MRRNSTPIDATPNSLYRYTVIKWQKIYLRPTDISINQIPVRELIDPPQEINVDRQKNEEKKGPVCWTALSIVTRYPANVQ